MQFFSYVIFSQGISAAPVKTFNRLRTLHRKLAAAYSRWHEPYARDGNTNPVCQMACRDINKYININTFTCKN